ncbi:MAG TPA: energy transducer TonB, partial [Rhodospirillaceae bacterium]|nr:energy transducer TonB [Rhodospirillaceae bacterium]
PDLPPPPPPALAPPPPPYIPPPEIQIRQPITPNAITAVTSVKPPEPLPPPVVKAEPVRVPPVIDPARACRQPEYPAASKRLEETGAVVLQFLVGIDGAVIESKVETTSGHSRLDEAALGALARCRFKAGTVDGKAEQSWARLRYVWKLE